MALIQVMISFLLLCVSFGAVGSFFVFLIDVMKWHNREERVKVRGSAENLPDEFIKESEVNENGQLERSDNGSGGSDTNAAPADTAESRQPDTSAFLMLGCDLDYVPIHKYEALTMCLQFLAALWFLYWFTKFMYCLLKGGLRGGL